MNDRFKFRVWDKENKKFLHDLSFDISYSGTLILSCGIEGKKYINPNDNNRYILIQCTGLKDKNGKLIYEGDVVKFKTELFGKPKQIIWNECRYMLKDTFIILCNMEIEQFGLEVIGNIYENKELLECRK